MQAGPEQLEMTERLPPGFRFFPTDEELITCYLARKAMDDTFTSTAIGDVELYNSEPWDLLLPFQQQEEECCYFFCRRGSRYPSGVRARRATRSGYWKSTGKDKAVYSRAGRLVGTKKTLVFYGGRAPRGEKTGWVMHEYAMGERRSSTLRGAQSEWVICRVFMRKPLKALMSDTKLEMETVHDQHHTSPGHLLPLAPDGCNSYGERDATQPVLTDKRHADGHSGGRDMDGDDEDHHRHQMVHEELLTMNHHGSSCSSPAWLIHDDQQLGAHCSALRTMQMMRPDDADCYLPELLEYDGYDNSPKRTAESPDTGGEMGRRAEISSASIGSFHLDELCWNFSF